MADHLDALKHLHTALIDTRKGYEEAKKDGPQSELLPLFERMITEHAEAEQTVADVLTRAGEMAEMDGSFMTTVNRAVISLRSMITGLGENILPALINGEQMNMKKYDAALEAGGLAETDRTAVDTCRSRLKTAITRMEHMAAA